MSVLTSVVGDGYDPDVDKTSAGKPFCDLFVIMNFLGNNLIQTALRLVYCEVVDCKVHKQVQSI